MKKKAKKEQDVLEYMRSISNIPRYEPMKTTLIEWCEYWLSTRANNLKDSTRSSYEYVINNHFKRVFKDMKLEDLTADDVQLFINSLIIGYQIPEPLNAKTIKNIHGVLHKALSVAVTQGCVPFNAAQGTVLPNIERTPPTPLTDAQIIKFFERIKYHEKRDIFIFALLTGLRESEIIGLTVNCFDKEGRTLKVYRQCVYNDRKHIYEFTSLKNSKMRVLSLTQQAYDILEKYCIDQGTEDFIFKNRNGRHFTPAAIYNSFKKVMRSIGCPNVRFHDLRHTHAVLMSQEQYEKLPMSAEHRLEFLNKQKAELLDQLSQSKRENGRRDPTVKEIERAIKAIEVRIEAITNPKSKSRGKDSLLNFESLGFDYLVVDEAHAYKNGFVSTKMGDVSGVNTRESGRAGDMQMKCDYFNSELGNGHILFATGTPVSNSMTELYVMTRYLRPDLLEDCGCARFDDWAATFGQIKTQNKKTATGELKLKTCFAGFKNRPELIKMYKDFADLITIDKITAPDKDGNAPTIVVPKVKTGKPQIIEVEATPEQREIVKDFARRGREIQLGNVRPDEDNLLKITGEARLVGLGNRAVLSVYEKNEWEPPIGFVADDKSGKIDKCIENVAEIYKDRYDKNAVQIIFSDIAVNSDDGKFSAYEYIRDELIANGVKEDEIIFAPKSDAKNRAEIFRDINEAKYRVVIASTGTLGTGANIQKNLYALHHLDIPWRPSDFEQREGRIVRQGNLNDEVEIFNYVTKGTLDSYLYQGVTDKARGIAQLWNDTCISRTSEDIDEKVLTFGELEAAAEGNPKLRQFSELKNKIDELQVVRAEYNKETTRVERRIKELPETIEAKKSLIAAAKNDSNTAKKMQHNGKLEELKLITHDNRTLTERKHINSYLAKQIQLRIEKPYDDIPSFRVSDFKITVAMSADRAHPDFAIKGERTAAYRLGVGVGDNTDNCQRLMNFFDKGIDKVIEIDTQSVEKDETDLAQAIERAAAKFPSEDDYQETLKAFEELETELSMGGYLDNGEEICGAEDYGTCDTERIDSNTDYDEDDLIQDEYNSTL